MKHFKKILLVLVLFFICGAVVHAEGNSFSTDTYYKNVCGVDFIPERIPKTISGIYSVVKTMLPVVIIILGMFDFLKAVMVNKQEDAVKHTNKFIRRIISGLLVFLIMAIVQFVFNSLGTINGYTNCMNCLLNNDRCGATYVKEKENTCESYSGDECPEEVDGVKCEKKETSIKTYCRSVCSFLQTKTQCDSRSYCDWNKQSRCGVAKVRIVPVKQQTPTTTTDNSPYSGSFIYNGAVNYYAQCDSPWGDERYGPPGAKTYCKAGCGPTSTAMVTSSLLGRPDIKPNTVGGWMTEKGLRGTNGGTSFNAIYSYLDSVGLKHFMVSSSDATMKELQSGTKIAIVNVKEIDKANDSCPFTNGGHYIVVTAYENGQYYVLDPGSKKRSFKYWPASDIFNKCGINGVIIVSK